jgi:transcriptional regulator with XRE-family HTH domain
MEKKTDVLTVYVSGKIEQYRHDAGMSQEDVAMKVGISRSSLVNMANGRQGVSTRRLYEIAEVLGVSPVQLLPDIDWWKINKNKKMKVVVTFEFE